MKMILLILLALAAVTPARAQFRGPWLHLAWGGAFLGAPTGSLYNLSGRHRSPEAVAIGAGVGFLLGGLSETRGHRNDVYYRDDYYRPAHRSYAVPVHMQRVAPAPVVTQQVTTTTTTYAAPDPQPTPSGIVYPGSGATFTSRVAYPGSR